MLTSGRSMYVIFLLVLMIICNTCSTFNVEQYCYQRCVQGKGGVLCNCHARHFGRKRSATKAAPHLYSPNFNTNRRFSEITGLASILQGGYLNPNEKANSIDGLQYTGKAEAPSAQNGGGNLGSNLWEGKDLASLISNLGQRRDADLIKGLANLSKNKDSTLQEAQSLPYLLLNQGDDSVSEDEDGEGKPFISDPYMDTLATDNQVNEDGDKISSDNSGEGSSASTNSHLTRLRNVLTQGLQGR
ncbi:unnamed protein product [Lymnaea stagnalis]|uniref:Uncharacterized protein n=1 Tax=Lymnaea stagnalis TaxID=6523 RepID=A0AAV2ILK0_LYMST